MNTRIGYSADDYAASYAASLDVYAAMRPRSLQADLGVSSVGHCSSEAMYRIRGVEPTDAPAGRQALMGTAIHEMVAAARKEFNPALLIETELTITMPSGVVITGHADEIDPIEPSVTDLKTCGDESDLAALRRGGATEQQRFQRHLYYHGAHQAGLVPAEGIVRNVWIDRAGRGEPYVEQEPFDPAVVAAADRWLADVRYAAEHDEEAPRDKPYDWCRAFCSFFSHCRAGQSHADYIITDPEFIAAAELVHRGRAEGKEAAGIEKHGRRVLEPLQQSADGDVAAFQAGDWRIRWQRVNAEKPYWKVAVDPADSSVAGAA